MLIFLKLKEFSNQKPHTRVECQERGAGKMSGGKMSGGKVSHSVKNG